MPGQYEKRDSGTSLRSRAARVPGPLAPGYAVQVQVTPTGPPSTWRPGTKGLREPENLVFRNTTKNVSEESEEDKKVELPLFQISEPNRFRFLNTDVSSLWYGLVRVLVVVLYQYFNIKTFPFFRFEPKHFQVIVPPG